MLRNRKPHSDSGWMEASGRESTSCNDMRGSHLGARSELNDREDEERTLSRLVTESAIYTLSSESP